MITTQKIKQIIFRDEYLLIEFEHDKIKIPIATASKKLLAANDLERNFYKVSPSGYGIHWPLIDEDLSVNGLMQLVK